MTAAKLVRCVLSFSRVSFSPAATVQRGLTAQRQLRCISSIRKNGEAAVKVEVQNPQTDASNFMNKTKLKPTEVDVGNSLRTEAIRSPSTSTSLSPIRPLFLTPQLGNEQPWQIGILKQTTIMDEASQPTYLDMQATTPTDPHILNAMPPVYTGLYRNPNSRTHTYGWETEKAIDVARKPVAKLMGAHPKEIRFTSGARESNNMSIKYVAKLYKSKKHTITSQTEHKHLQDEGYNITYLPVKNKGLINREHLEKEISQDTAPVSIMTRKSESGVEKRVSSSKQIGSQAVGKIPVKVGEWNVDLMSIRGPKVYGPQNVVFTAELSHTHW
ncbi:PLP-dependent transferase [Choiromyces venosus 120613-1]|uniref:PLP-dependent transferase n=1 Tax=Choiromyces venosus 120613-1 TaxID=1336337 RepID=A0A3N4JK47_9PEZI|nr:PLP-dependent transferase [Choiromyces venosus 120613-1]